MAKRKVTQDDLRKLMAQAKTAKGPAPASSASSKRYKLSSRELALLEEQKREDERKRAKEREKKASALAGLPAPDAVPQKSILKNKSAPGPPIIRPSNITIVTGVTPSTVVKPTIPSTDNRTIPVTSTSGNGPSTSVNVNTQDSSKNVEKTEDENSTALPEGFFDDPVLDAKARHVQYVDTAEEEWERFQKEIGDEMNVAQDILVEDRIEATMDRQIEEIDEQMRAWSRVAVMEKKKEETVKINPKPQSGAKKASKEESDEDEEFEEFLDWRNKK